MYIKYFENHFHEKHDEILIKKIIKAENYKQCHNLEKALEGFLAITFAKKLFWSHQTVNYQLNGKIVRQVDHGALTSGHDRVAEPLFFCRSEICACVCVCVCVCVCERERERERERELRDTEINQTK